MSSEILHGLSELGVAGAAVAALWLVKGIVEYVRGPEYRGNGPSKLSTALALERIENNQRAQSESHREIVREQRQIATVLVAVSETQLKILMVTQENRRHLTKFASTDEDDG